MMTTPTRLSSVLLSLSLVLASLAPAAPAAAETISAAPARLAPTVLPIRSVNFTYSPVAAEIPAAALTQNIGVQTSPALLPETVVTAQPTMETTIAAPSALPSAPPSAEAVAANPTFNPSARTVAEPPAERQSWTARLRDAIKGKLSWSQVFDLSASKAVPSAAMGIRPLPAPNLPAGVKLDPPPAAPDSKKVPGVTIEGFFSVPGAKSQGGPFEAGPRLLNANVNDPKDVERALRALVDADAARYGLTSAELVTVHAEHTKYKTHQTETVTVLFKQTRASKNADGTTERVPVHGTRLSFTVKNIDGQAVLYSSMGKLYPSIAVNTNRTLTDAQLKEQAQKRLGIPPSSSLELQLIERKIIYSQGGWHDANIYVIEGYPVMIAVDVATGDAFAWDPRMGFEADSKASAEAVGRIIGRGERSDSRPNGKPELVPLDMHNLEITMADGSKVLTKGGKLVVESKDGKEVAFTAALEGSWARVVDAQGRSLKINGSVKPGVESEHVYNPHDAEEWVYNLINTFQGINRVHDWLYERFPDKRLNRAIKGTANIDQECNAYYTPGSPSLNFFRSSANCSDTGRPGIIAHEYGHFWDDMIGGIVNGGLSEGWGDILSMYIFGSPIIGDGFLKNTSQSFPANFLTKMGVSAATLHGWADSASRIPLVGGALEGMLRPSYIRHGENTYQYSENDQRVKSRVDNKNSLI